MTDAQKQLEWLFATPLIGFMHPNPDRLNSQLWLDASRLREEDKGLARSNRGGWHSQVDLFKRPESSFQHLRKWAVHCSNMASKMLNKDFLAKPRKASFQAWININGQGCYNNPHSHPGCHWSGVYYARVPDPESGSFSGMIEFLDPRGGVTKESALPDAKCFLSNYSVTPQNGLLLLFPPYLVHWVHPHQHPEERLSIAFNIKYGIEELDNS